MNLTTELQLEGRFGKGSRDAFHSHAFNAITWWVKGEVEEQDYLFPSQDKTWRPSLIPKLTPKGKFHKIIAKEVSWAICIRGKWDDTWEEYKNGERYSLTHGRKRL